VKKNKIIVHCVVKNEENFIWYALQSVLPFVDKIMVWDTGSEDKTVEIIKSIKSPKIDFVEKGSVDANSFTGVRNEMIQKTDKQKYNWLMILDGDEIWSKNSLNKVIKYINSHPKTQAIFINTINAVGDIYHKQPQSAGHYKIKGKAGHLSLRFINLKEIPNLKVDLPHGQQGFFSNGQLIQDLPRVDYVDTAYLHTTHLPRSSRDKSTIKRSLKLKYELGNIIPPRDIPEVIFGDHPSMVPDLTKRMSLWTYTKCLIFTLPRRLKRALFQSPEGY